MSLVRNSSLNAVFLAWYSHCRIHTNMAACLEDAGKIARNKYFYQLAQVTEGLNAALCHAQSDPAFDGSGLMALLVAVVSRSHSVSSSCTQQQTVHRSHGRKHHEQIIIWLQGFISPDFVLVSIPSENYVLVEGCWKVKE